MKKFTHSIIAAILVLTSCTTNTKDYLPTAPYIGLLGEIDSVEIVQYMPSQDETNDVIQTATLYVFDKNGHIVKERQQIYNLYPNSIMAEVTTTTIRSSNSLPTAQIVRQVYNQKEVMEISFEMSARHNNKESYIVKAISYSDDAEIEEEGLIGQEWIVRTYNNKTINTIMIFDGIESNTDERYDENGRLIYKAVEITNDDKFDDMDMSYEKELIYDKNGLALKNITTREGELGTTIKFYKNYQTEELSPHNWISREVLNQDGELIRIEKQNIFYRKK